ncbi:MAG: peptidase M23 [Microbacterium sp. SCN 70-200]|uniref:M23 family metallopeptidase n=1 Tax=unclassified Microbacterium TaxID=2609290 RepID=UPI00086F94AD|nr:MULTISPECIES: M23 family metallopeptidase [unclassified Microbacterium]MBN9215344.1 peptidoglycan DD-metalloendopeptidase family protein [Microbacterium sp.]ODT42738.1 MAG: peptidase M23 [Microbacterium sp. SCN 70-200]OJV79788.1 MAG: peptidase M23 [Microbacterium sp. 70-16]
MDEAGSPEDCGCAPTERELRSLRSPLSRRTALGLGGLGILGLSALGAGLGSAAFAADYPSWDDVQRAKNNESAKAAEVTRIEGLIADLQADVAAKQAEAERLAGEYAAAQEAYETAAADAASLQDQANAEDARAKETAEKLGRLAAQQYRTGGDDAALELFFSGSAATADDLLAKLGTMDRLVAANQGVYADAVGARDNATNLSKQAQVARDERDRLQQVAEQKMVAAQDAAVAAQAALDTQTANLDTLQAQLAALKDTTAKTIADYQTGVEVRRREEEARKAAAAAAAKAAAEAAAKAAAEAAANAGSGSGSSSGGTGGQAGSSGWVRPASGYISSWFGNRGTICGNGYCTTGHRGIDFATSCWSPIYAAAAGTVVFAAYADSWGNYIKVDHGGGIVTGYAHIATGGYVVGYGQWVNAGQLIAYVGNTGASSGCHLHFEVYSGGVRIDPAPFLRARGISV